MPVPRVEVGAPQQQRLDRRSVALDRGKMKRCRAEVVSGSNIRARTQQQLNCVDALLRGVVKRRVPLCPR